jgi:hypothetical protein
MTGTSEEYGFQGKIVDGTERLFCCERVILFSGAIVTLRWGRLGQVRNLGFGAFQLNSAEREW